MLNYIFVLANYIYVLIFKKNYSGVDCFSKKLDLSIFIKRVTRISSMVGLGSRPSKQTDYTVAAVAP